MSEALIAVVGVAEKSSEEPGSINGVGDAIFALVIHDLQADKDRRRIRLSRVGSAGRARER
jgi:hypothetical protein